MGWWNIGDKCPTGQGESSLINAIPNRDSSEDHYMGDGPADIMDQALIDICNLYKKEWKRLPYLEEIEACINFSMSSIRADGNLTSCSDIEES